MIKTFVLTPVAGALAAFLGWLGAGLIREAMGPAEFATFRFGWTGALIGATAAVIILFLLLIGDLIEPIVMTVVAGVVGAALWNRTELPFDTTRFTEGTTSSYWLTVTIMGVTFLMLVLGLRAARESTSTYRSGRS
jgi:hypothetical protein